MRLLALLILSAAILAWLLTPSEKITLEASDFVCTASHDDQSITGYIGAVPVITTEKVCDTYQRKGGNA